MKTLFHQDLGHDKLMIGMVHTLALPGVPLYDRAGGMRRIVRQSIDEARILQDCGFHALLYCNESDMPYAARMAPETVAAMTEVVAETQATVGLPHGINMLLDPEASMAIAHATGGRFIRCFVSGAYVGDLGFYVPDGAALMRQRAALGAEDVRVIANVTAGFSVTLDARPTTARASGAVFCGLADAVCVSGPAAGAEAALDEVADVARAVPDTPVVVGTGVSAGNIAALATVADAFIVGTSLKYEGKTLNPVDPQRAQQFMQAVHGLPN